MKIAMAVLFLSLGITSTAQSQVFVERVTGGALDLVWLNGFGVSANMQPMTLSPGHPAYANPSGDHTVARATSMPVDSGGIVLSATETYGTPDYSWEAWVFTGDGNTRRGLVVRADPNNDFQSNYQFVIQNGAFQLALRKLVNGAPTTLGSWFATVLPAGSITLNAWHKMRVVAMGPRLSCFFDDFELTPPGGILDTELTEGWVGVYNFRFDLGSIDFLTDDLTLELSQTTPAATTTWGRIKAAYR